MNKATNIKNGNVNLKCEYCGGCGYHKLSCTTQKVTVFLSDEKSDNELARQIGKLSDEEFENNCIRLSKMFKQK